MVCLSLNVSLYYDDGYCGFVTTIGSIFLAWWWFRLQWKTKKNGANDWNPFCNKLQRFYKHNITTPFSGGRKKRKHAITASDATKTIQQSSCKSRDVGSTLYDVVLLFAFSSPTVPTVFPLGILLSKLDIPKKGRRREMTSPWLRPPQLKKVSRADLMCSHMSKR